MVFMRVRSGETSFGLQQLTPTATILNLKIIIDIGSDTILVNILQLVHIIQKVPMTLVQTKDTEGKR